VVAALPTLSQLSLMLASIVDIVPVVVVVVVDVRVVEVDLLCRCSSSLTSMVLSSANANADSRARCCYICAGQLVATRRNMFTFSRDGSGGVRGD